MCEPVFVVNIMHRNILLEVEATLFWNPRRTRGNQAVLAKKMTLRNADVTPPPPPRNAS